MLDWYGEEGKLDMVGLYTCTGDFGCTMIHDSKEGKDSPAVKTIGAIDELQSSLDIARINLESQQALLIENIQDKLRHLAGEIVGYVTDEEKLISNKDLDSMEAFIDKISYYIPKKFMRFNHTSSIYLNEARVRTRALERKMVVLLNSNRIRKTVYQYINRLSDLLFVLSYKTELSYQEKTRE